MKSSPAATPTPIEASATAKRIRLYSSDHALTTRIGRTLAPNESLVTVRSGKFGEVHTRGTDLVVLDRRGSESHEIRVDDGTDGEGGAPRALIVHPCSVKTIETLVYRGTRSHEVAIADGPAVGLLLRAYLNNEPHGVAAAQALGLALRLLSFDATDILNASIASGFTARSVKEVAAHLRRDRGTLRRRLSRTDGIGQTPRDIIGLSKAIYGAILLWTTELRFSAVSRLLGFSSPVSLRVLMEKTFGAPLSVLSDAQTELAPDEHAEALLRRRIS